MLALHVGSAQCWEAQWSRHLCCLLGEDCVRAVPSESQVPSCQHGRDFHVEKRVYLACIFKTELYCKQACISQQKSGERFRFRLSPGRKGLSVSVAWCPTPRTQGSWVGPFPSPSLGLESFVGLDWGGKPLIWNYLDCPPSCSWLRGPQIIPP